MKKKTRVSWVGFVGMIGAAPLGGCAYDVGTGDGTVITEVREPSHVWRTTLFTNNNWEVPVCFHTASTASDTAKALFQQVVREQWEANTGLTFTGFQTCTSTAAPWVPVYLIQTSSPFGNGQSGIGARQTNNTSGWPKDSQIAIGYSSEANLPYPAVHEMGHAIGLVHEHQRPDGDNTSNRCVIPRSGGDGVIITGQLYATVDDPLSIMHYCWIANGNSPSTLSALDIVGAQMIYGRHSSATAEFGFQRVILSGIPPAFSFNSTGATNSFTHDGPGRYTAIFPRMGQTGGNVQVTPYNSLNRCSIVWWSDDFNGGAATAINCFNAAGTLTDTEFTVSFVGRWDGSSIPEGGYVWAFDPWSDFYAATGSYTWNSTGQPVNIDRTSTGVYDVIFIGQNFAGGTAEVSAYGGGTEYCKLDSIGRINNNSDKRVRVRCFSGTGTPIDAFFSLRLSKVSPTGTPTYSYALADQPSNTQVYTPSSNNRLAYRPNLIGGTTNLSPLTVRRSSQGVYIVTLPQMPYTDDSAYLYKKSNLHVAAVGTGNEYCQISTLTGDSLGQNEQATQALVICMNPAGTAFVDSKFIISYGSMLVDAPDSTILSTVERLPQNGASGIGGLAVANGNLYFTRSFDNVSGGQIMRLSPSGGTPTSVVANQSATGLFADSNNLIWVGNNSVKKSALNGTSVVTLASNQSLLTGNPTADANNVYFRTKVTALGTATRISKVSRNGGTPVFLTPSDQIPVDPVTDGTFVYFSAFTLTGNRIAKVSVNGGTVTTVVLNKGGGALARSGSTLYFTDFNTNDLYKVPTSGGTPTLIAKDIPRTTSVTSLVTDGTNVYGALAAGVGNTIFKANVNPGSTVPSAQLLAFHEAVKSPLALDTSGVYFVATTGTNGYLTVSRTTK